MKQKRTDSHVAELQGPYGPLQVLEIKIQQVWGLQQCQPGRWLSRTGKPIKVRSPGIWNRGAGPDFREAVLELDGETRVGDVEIHLYREDWWRHGHDGDSAYDNVVLHVVLFAGGMDRDVCTSSGHLPEEWVMGPWMREDVESVSGGEPGLFGELVPELREWIESGQTEDLRERLLVGADRRWQDKESMARCLIEMAGWEGALHRMTLYYLGFPSNRKAFFAMAEAYPPDDWQSMGLMDRLSDQWADRVRWNCGRPANRARPRLWHYIELNRRIPDWRRRLKCPPPVLRERLRDGVGMAWPGTGTRQVRTMADFPVWRRWINREVLGGVLGPGLVDRLWIDVFLPLLTAGGFLSREGAMVLWFHGYPAQYPAAYGDLLRLAGINDASGLTRCNGWIQGFLWMEDQLRLERIRSSTGPAPAFLPGSGA
jgi:hypothetical protein